MTYIIRNRDETWDVSAAELSALHLQVGDSLDADELIEALRSAGIPNDLRGWLAAMAEAAPEQVIYVEGSCETF